jgi:hypothetical protein
LTVLAMPKHEVGQLCKSHLVKCFVFIYNFKGMDELLSVIITKGTPNEKPTKKNATLCNMTSCTLIITDVSYQPHAGRHQAGGCRFLWNVGIFLPDYTASKRRIQ